jgi:starch synthase
MPKPKTVFTIHSMAFQGIFPSTSFDHLNLPSHILSADDLEYFGRISLLKAGLKYADRLTTVSPSYAAEILTPAFGCGLDGLLRERAEDLTGILNGVDRQVWDPAADPHLSAWFDRTDLAGKHQCKRALQAELGLDAEPSVPLVVYASRLTDQKMADVVLQAIPSIAAMGAQFALIGEGDRGIEDALHSIGQTYAGRVSTSLGYREDLAHRHYAGGDIILAPARFEPCGLAPMYGMLYGALPVVRRVGGMIDTVVDATPESIRMDRATGFTFDDPSLDQMMACLGRAFWTFHDEVTWRRIMRTGMTQPWGWERPAQYYQALYAELAEVSTRVAIGHRPAMSKDIHASEAVDEPALVGM